MVMAVARLRSSRRATPPPHPRPLGPGPRPVGQLVDGLRISQPAVSKHLRVLREAGLVEASVDAQRRLYALRPEALRELDLSLAHYRALWSTSLDRLEQRLDEMDEMDAAEPGGTDAANP